MNRIVVSALIVLILIVLPACSKKSSSRETTSAPENIGSDTSAPFESQTEYPSVSFNELPEKELQVVHTDGRKVLRYIELPMDAVLDNEPWDKVPPTDAPVLRVISLQ